jgi:hypothetical protein
LDDVAKQIAAVPRGGWRAILGAVLLIVPASGGWMAVLTSPGAAALALETLALAAVYARTR